MKLFFLLLVYTSTHFSAYSQPETRLDSLGTLSTIDSAIIIQKISAIPIFMNCAHGHICCQSGCGCCGELFRGQVYDTVRQTNLDGIQFSIVEERYPVASFHGPSFIQFIFMSPSDQREKKFFYPKGLQMYNSSYRINSYYEKGDSGNYKKLFKSGSEFVFDDDYDFWLIDETGTTLPIPFHSLVKIQDNVYRSSIIIDGQRLYCLADSLGNKISKLKYSAIRFDENNQFALVHSSRNFNFGVALIDLRGNEIIPNGTSDLKLINQGLYAANGSLYNQSGTRLTQEYYNYFGEAKDGLIAVKKNNKIGYINLQGKEVITPQFEWAHEFGSGRAAVYDGTKWGFIDTTGELVIPYMYDNVRTFSEGLAIVGVGENSNTDKWGIINTRGKYILKPTYDDMYGFKDGLASASIKGQGSGYVNKRGKEVIPCIYLIRDQGSETSWFPFGKIVFQTYGRDWKLSLNDAKGKKIMDLNQYRSVRMLTTYYSTRVQLPYLKVWKESMEIGLVDLDGDVILEAIYQDIVAVGDSLLVIRDGSKVKLYNLETRQFTATMNGRIVEYFQDSIGMLRKPNGTDVYVTDEGAEIEEY